MSHPIRLFFELIGSLAALLLVAVGVLLWRLSVGPVVVPFVTPLIEAALREGSDGFTVDVGQSSLDWSSSSRSIELRVADVRVLAADGAEIVRVPEAWIALSANRLLHFELQPESFRIQGLRLNLTRAADGTIQFFEAPGQGAEPAAAAGGGSLAAFLVAEFAGPADPGRALGLLSQAIFSDATIVVDDAMTGLRLAAEHANLVLQRTDQGLRLKAAIPAAIGGQRLPLDLDALYVAQNERVEFDLRARGLSVGGLADLDPRLADLRGLDATLDLQVRASIGLDGKLAPLALAVDASGVRLLDRAWFDKPVAIDRASLRATIAGDFDRLEIEELRVDAGAASIRATATLEAALSKPRLAAKVDIAGLTTDELKRLWPLFASPNARSWIAANVAGGRIASAKADLALGSADAGWSAVNVDRLRFDFAIEGAAVTFIDGLPPVEGVGATATMDAKRLEMKTRSGTVAGLQAGEGTIVLSGLDQDQQYATIDLRVSGATRDALGLVDRPPLGFLARIGERPNSFGGRSETRIAVKFPLLANLKLDDVDVVATGRILGYTQQNAVLGQSIEDGTVDFRVDAKGLDVKGPVRLAGATAEIAYRREFDANANPVERASAKGTAPTRSVNRLGFDFAPYAVGPVGFAMSTSATRDGRRELDLELDLAEVDFAVPEIDWSRSPAKGTKAAMRLSLGNEKLQTISGLDLAGEGLALKGDVMFAEDGRTFREAKLSRLLLAGRVDLDAAAVRREPPRAPGQPMRNVFEGRGAFFDAAPFLADKTPPEPGRPALKLDLEVAKAALGAGRELSALTLRGERSALRWEQLAVDARTQPRTSDLAPGTLRIAIAPAADGLLVLRGSSDDAGALLAALDITPNVVGGKLAVEGKEDPARADRAIVGKVAIEDFRLVNAPGFAKLLSVALLTGILDSLRGDGIGFSRLDADIAWADPKIEIKDGRMHGAALGLTARGQVDLAADTLQIDGTIVPAYAVNSILGNIPLLGQLLVGERGSGVFAANYRASGAMADVQTTINPLSTLAPGFLRRVFGLFSGGAQGETTVPDPINPNDSMR